MPGGLTFLRPFLPEPLGGRQRRLRVDRLRWWQVRRRIAHHERHDLAFADAELADRAHVTSDEMHRGPHYHHIGTRDGAMRAVVEPSEPGDHGTIAKAQHQLGMHGNAAALANDEPYHARLPAVDRHAVDQHYRAFGALEAGLQDQRLATIGARDASVAVARPN